MQKPNKELFQQSLSKLRAEWRDAGPYTMTFKSIECISFPGLNNLLVAGVVGGTLWLLTPIFRFMPMNAMAAIVIMGVLSLVDFQRAFFYLRVSNRDFNVTQHLLKNILLELSSTETKAQYCPRGNNCSTH